MKSIICKFIFILISFIIIPHNVKAQLFPYRQYTTTDELASSNVNDIIHDARGYLWFATDRGVSRFDGFKFTNYLFKEGLPVARIVSFATNNEGKIIAGSYCKGVGVFDNNFHDILTPSDLLPNEQSIYTGSYFYSLKKGEFITVADMRSKAVKKLELGALPYAIIKNNEGEILVATDKGVMKISGDHLVPNYLASPGHSIYALYHKNGVEYRAGAGVIYTENITGIERAIPVAVAGTITNFVCSANGDFWFTTGENNRLYLQQTDGTLIDFTSKLQIDGTQINKIFEDNEGNIWIATSGKGIFCMNHFYTVNFTKTDGLKNEFITALQSDEMGNLFIGTSNGIYYLHDNLIHEIPKEGNKSIRDIRLSQNKLIVSCGDKLVQTIHYEGMPIEFVNGSPSFFGIPGLSDSSSTLVTVNDVYTDKQNNTWIATNNGLQIISGKGIEVPDTTFLSSDITCITHDKKDAIYFGTDNGLVKFEKGKWKYFSQLKGKSIESITSLETDDKNRIWIGTLTGLYMWDGNTIIQFDTKNVLLSDEINALSFDRKHNFMWAGSSFGLSCINIAQFDTTRVFAPAALFKNLRTADSFYREADLQQDLLLHYKSSNFTLRFTAIHFSTPEGVKFMYKYDDAEWQPAIGRQIEFASMPYGKHVFKIKAIGERDIEGPEASLNIIVQTPFWATTWFKITAGFVIALLAYSIIRLRFNSIKKKQQERLELQAKIAELRHQALAGSMNPHFIFNALNSIQQFINIHDTDEASEYLGKFARLIRIMLNSGGKTFISLSEELERLKYYLDLEKIRFGNKLTFHISVDEQIQASETEIPNMVIQPIVENALWHGLLPANKDGILNISFSKLNGILKVLVDDNGIGINESRKRKKSGHVSLGLQMIEERLSLLNKLNGYEARFTIRDKSELDPPAQGTIAEIHFS